MFQLRRSAARNNPGQTNIQKENGPRVYLSEKNFIWVSLSELEENELVSLSRSEEDYSIKDAD